MNGLESGAALAVSLAAAVIPTILYILFIRWLDRYEREPLVLVTGAFLWGCVPAVVLSVIAELALGIPFSGEGCTQFCDIIQSAGIAPVVEELVKALALLGLVVFFRGEFDGVLDGVIYGMLIGFGFAMTENFLYFVGSFAEAGWESLWTTILFRSGAFGLTHAFFTGLVGAGFGYALGRRAGRVRRLIPLVALAAAIGFHALHNFGVSIAGDQPAGFLITVLNYVVGVSFLLVIVIWSLAQQKKWIREELKAEVGVTITAGEYELVTRKRYLAAKKIGPLARIGGRRVFLLAELSRLATELAFKKHQLRTRGESNAINNAITQLRTDIGALREAATELADSFIQV